MKFDFLYRFLVCVVSFGVLSTNSPFSAKAAADKIEKTDKIDKAEKMENHFGKKFELGTESEKIELKKLYIIDAKATADKKSDEVVLDSQVVGVCKQKGCWLEVESASGPLHVTFKNYGFFVPKELNGKKVLLKGKFVEKIESVKEQRHYLEDAGKTEEEQKKIQEARRTIRFEASGVVVK